MILHGKEKGAEDLKKVEFEKLLSLYSQKLTLENAKKIALINPDNYMALRKIKENIKFENISKEEVKKLLSESTLFILANPRSYGAWYHRIFIIKNISKINSIFTEIISKEEILIRSCLEHDPRIFHCWNYLKFLNKEIMKINKSNKYEQIEIKECEKLNPVQNEYLNDEVSDIVKSSVFVENDNCNNNEILNSTLYPQNNYITKDGKSLDILSHIGLDIFNTDFGNYGALFEIVFNNIGIKNIESKLFTDPYDEGLWKYYEYIQENKNFNNRNFYIRIFEDQFEIIFQKIIDDNKNLEIYFNNEKLEYERRYLSKKLIFHKKVNKNDLISINGDIFEFKENLDNFPIFIDELLDICENSPFVYLFKLKYTKDVKIRKFIIDHLQKIDKMRYFYYEDMIDKFYYIL